MIIRKIIVHCSATREGQNISADEIRKWHKDKGWSDIGYHYIIGLDGTIAKGRKDNVPGAHCRGHNRNSLGVCYVGGVEQDGKTPKDTRTNEQKQSLETLLEVLKVQHLESKVYGHRDFAAKACPSFDATEEYN